MRAAIHRILAPSGIRLPRLRAASARPLALLLLLLSTGCLGITNPLTRVDAPTMLLLDVRPIQDKGLERRLELDLLLQNPNNFDVVLDGIRLALDMNGQRIAQAVSSQSVAIDRLGDTRVTIQASVTLIESARSLLSLGGRERNGSLSYRVAGDVFVSEPRSTRVSFDDNGEVLPGTSVTAR